MKIKFKFFTYIIFTIIILYLSSCTNDSSVNAFAYRITTDPSDPEGDGSYNVYITLDDFRELDDNFYKVTNLNDCTIFNPEDNNNSSLTIHCYDPGTFSKLTKEYEHGFEFTYIIFESNVPNIIGLVNYEEHIKEYSETEYKRYFDEINNS